MEYDIISMEKMRDALRDAAGIPQHKQLSAKEKETLNNLYVSAKNAGLFSCQEGRIYINKDSLTIARENIEKLSRNQRNVIWGLQKAFFGFEQAFEELLMEDFINSFPMKREDILEAIYGLVSNELVELEDSPNGYVIKPMYYFFNMWTPAWDIAGGTFKVGSWKTINNSVVFSGYTEYKTYSEAWVSLVKEMRATPKKTKPCFGIVLNGQKDFGYDKYGPVSEINPVW